MDISQERQLFSASFPGDEKDYIDYFYEDLRNTAQFVGKVCNNKLVAMTYIFNKNSFLWNNKIDIPFFVGVCTAEKMRGKGYASYIMTSGIRKLYDEGYILASLYPFNHRFYVQYGFSTISEVAVYDCNGDSQLKLHRCDESDINSLVRISTNYLSSHRFYQNTDSAFWKRKLDEQSKTNIDIFIANDTDIILRDSEVLLYAFSDNISNIVNSGKFAGFKCVDLLGSGEEHTQARIINVAKLLKLWVESGYCPKTTTYSIVDDTIPQNNISVKITVDDKKREITRINGSDNVITIAELCKEIFVTYGGKDKTLFVEKN